VLSLLTAYFIQNKKLFIPGIGSFELKRVPADLSFADRLLYPPTYNIIHHHSDQADEEQSLLLAKKQGVDVNTINFQLQEIGESIKNQLQKGSFTWHGIGVLSMQKNKIVFVQEDRLLLLPVPANKILRDHVKHKVLRGDREYQDIAEEELIPAERKTSRLSYILWGILVIALIFTGYHFYKNGFKLTSTGSKVKAVSLPASTR
jgi:hypothetical protein